MITLLLTLSLIGQSQADPSESNKIVYIDFEDADVKGILAGPRLTIVVVKPTVIPDILIPDVRQVFIDKNTMRATE